MVSFFVAVSHLSVVQDLVSSPLMAMILSPSARPLNSAGVPFLAAVKTKPGIFMANLIPQEWLVLALVRVMSVACVSGRAPSLLMMGGGGGSGGWSFAGVSLPIRPGSQEEAIVELLVGGRGPQAERHAAADCPFCLWGPAVKSLMCGCGFCQFQ